jgi:hypothetical protein
MSAMMQYDAQRRRVLLFGGSSTVLLGDSWEWDGTTWTRVMTEAAPSQRTGGGVAFDAIAREMVVFGGTGIGSDRDDTWVFRYEAPLRDVERCAYATEDLDGDERAGCEDPDCWGRCAPRCPPATSCDPSTPRCGDGTCAPVEDTRLCPADCS